MKVNNHKDFACFDFDSNTCLRHELGDIVLKETVEETQTFIEIGVIIQIHGEGEYRTDMFGNCSLSEIRLATIGEIERCRPALLEAV